MSAAGPSSTIPLPPLARKEKVECKSEGGHIWHDEFQWLRGDGDEEEEEILSYLKAENDYAEAVAGYLHPLQEQVQLIQFFLLFLPSYSLEVYREFRSRTREEDASVPHRDGPFLYFTRIRPGSQYHVYCRKPAAVQSVESPCSLSGGESVSALAEEEEEVLLDVNEEAKPFSFYSIGQTSPSPDHTKFAYSFDSKGDERFTIRILDLSTRLLLPDVITDTAYDIEWSADSSSIFYTLRDDQNQPNRVMKHTLGTSPSADILLYEEKDPAFYLSLSKFRDNSYLLITLEETDTTEILLVPAADARAETIRVFQQRTKGLLYSLEHHPSPYPLPAPSSSSLDSHRPTFFILTNANGAEDFQVMLCADEFGSTAVDHWQSWIPHTPGRRITSLNVFENNVLLQMRKDALLRIAVVDLPIRDDFSLAEITWNSEISKTRLRYHPEFSTTFIQVLF
jgi:oligopeptidase B